MQSKGKIILVRLVLIVAAAAVIYVLTDNEAKGEEPELAQTVEAPPSNLTPGKERMLATLKNESLDQSIKLLIDDREQYSFPFVAKTIVGGQEDLEQMLSTRRLWKVLQEIKELPKSEGDAKCEMLFSTAFQLHTNISRAMIKYATDPSAPTNHSSVQGTLMGMSAAMFIAADTARLGMLEKQFAQLDQWRDEIKPLANLPNRIVDFEMPALTVRAIAPDFRLQVNVLRLAALRSGDAKMLKAVDEACASIQMKAETFSLVAWNAETKDFELLPDSLRIPARVTVYTFYDWSFKMAVDYANSIFHTNSDELPGIKDEQLFVKKLESIVFKGTTSP
jgi:hypothetical protein